MAFERLKTNGLFSESSNFRIVRHNSQKRSSVPRPNAVSEEMLGKGLPSVYSPSRFGEYLHPDEVSGDLITV